MTDYSDVGRTLDVMAGAALQPHARTDRLMHTTLQTCTPTVRPASVPRSRELWPATDHGVFVSQVELPHRICCISSSWYNDAWLRWNDATVSSRRSGLSL